MRGSVQAEGRNLLELLFAGSIFCPFQRLVLSQKNLGLEFASLVLYYSVRPSGVVPHDAKPPNHLLVSSIESF